MEIVRMRVFLRCFYSFALFALFALNIYAAQPAKSKGKLVIFQMQRVFEQSKRGQQLRNKMQEDAEQQQKELIKQKQEIEKLDKELKEKQVLLSEEAKVRRQQELQEKFLAFRNSEMKFHSELQQKKTQATHMMTVEVQEIVDKLDYDMVYERSQVFHIKKSLIFDITDKIISSYNKKIENLDKEKLANKKAKRSKASGG
jgi:Skp family chaperone for outer membrane proteins